MPNTNEYHCWIHIRDERGSGDNSPVAATANTPLKGQQNGDEADPARSRLENRLKGFVSYSFVKGQADRAMNYQISLTALRTGRSEYQQRVSEAYNTASSSLDFAKQEMFLIGSQQYGIAVLNAIQKVAGVAIDYGAKTNTMRLERSLEQQEQLRERIRIGTGGRRDGNQ